METRLDDPRVQELLAELQVTFRQQFPEARFEVSEGRDPPGVYLDVWTEDDSWLTSDVLGDRLVDVLIEEGLSLHVIPRCLTADAAAGS